MSKGNNLQSLFCGILFCISITALIIACLAFTKGKGGGGGEYYTCPGTIKGQGMCSSTCSGCCIKKGAGGLSPKFCRGCAKTS